MHHILYHDNCADGFSAYCLLRHSLQGQAQAAGLPAPIIRAYPCQYERPLPLLPSQTQPEDSVWFVDYTPEAKQGGADILTEFATGRFLSIFDHHETAFWRPKTQDHEAGPGTLLEFMMRPDPLYTPVVVYSPSLDNATSHAKLALDLARWDIGQPDQSGAGMLWDWTSTGSSITRAVRLIQFRDLGYAWTAKKQHPDTAEDSHCLHAAIMRTIPRTYEAWIPVLLNWQRGGIEGLLELGHKLCQQDDQLIQILVHNAGEATIGGYRVKVAEGISAALTSNLANALLVAHPEIPFAAVRWVNPSTGAMTYSLRGRNAEGAVNVGTLAHSYGGGGHAQSAGFSTLEPLSA